MDRMVLLLFDLMLVLYYSLIGFATCMLIQLISYRGFGFNIYKTILKYTKINMYERRV